MKKRIIIVALGLQGLAAWAQNGTSFQVFNAEPKWSVGDFKVLTLESTNGKTISGRPLSAVEERHTLQVLGDGTRIENTSTDQLYRDDQGRTRIEQQNGAIVIHDPVQGVTAELNGDHRTVRRTTPSRELVTKLKLEAQVIQFQKDLDVKMDKLKAEALNNSEVRREEDLGYRSVNGVTAQGVRTTTTIPAGQIGNDRPIQIVAERWYSSDLQMTIKSTNSDPRFGETTYQLKNIVQGAPDPALFQIPADVRQ